MICSDCVVAATFNSNGNYDKAEELHDYCKGDCGCLHKTGAGWFIKAGEKPKAVQTQSP